MKFFNKQYAIWSALIVAGALLGAGITAFFYHRQIQTIATQISPVHDQSDSYTFINPLLFYRIPDDAVLDQDQALQTTIQNTVNTLTTGTQNHVSIYYNDLNTGHWVGINPDDQYTPASLLKVVIMIAYFQEAQTDPSVLSKEIMYTPAIQSLLGALPDDQDTILKLGESYTIDALINTMIIQSDNGAAYTLLSAIDEKTINDIYVALGLGNPDTAGRNYTISARTYSFFFRVLYNATYLNRDMSERALALLAKADFKDGLVAGVPTSVTISHKYGESETLAADGSVASVELHDCGIVYTKNPYFLCVMTRGADITSLEKIIQTLSHTVYTAVNGT